MSTEAELEAENPLLESEIASLRERLRMQGEMLLTSPTKLLKAIAERNQQLAALQAPKPLRLKVAAAQLGISYRTEWGWIVDGKLQQLPAHGAAVMVDANESRPRREIAWPVDTLQNLEKLGANCWHRSAS